MASFAEAGFATLSRDVMNDAPTYSVGEIFTYMLDDDYDRTMFHEQELVVEVTHTFAPFTCSPVMRVSYDTKQGPKSAILKTYDRRAGWASRRDPYDHDKIIQYDPAVEDELVRLVQEGRAPALWARFQGKERYGPNDPAERECYYQMLRVREYHSEIQAYEKMQHLQGICIPRFLASLRWQPECAGPEFMFIGAILIEEVENAMTLQELYAQPDISIPNSLRRAIKAECKKVNKAVEAAGIADPDRHNRNALIVMHDLARQQFTIFQIDFGFSCVKPDEQVPSADPTSQTVPEVEQEQEPEQPEPSQHEPTTVKKIKLNLPSAVRQRLALARRARLAVCSHCHIPKAIRAFMRSRYLRTRQGPEFFRIERRSRCNECARNLARNVHCLDLTRAEFLHHFGPEPQGPIHEYF